LDGNGVVPPGGECLALLMCVDGTCVPVDVDFGPGNITCPEVDDFGGCFMDADGPGLLTVVHPAYYGTPAWFEDFVPAEVPPECDPLLSWSSVECFTGPNDLQCFGEHVDALDIVIPISCAPTGEGLLLLPFIRNCDPSLAAAQALLGLVTCGEANRACMQTLDGAEVYTMPACSVL
jgi:hypothetical protein